MFSYKYHYLISINKKITYSSSLNIKEAKDDLVLEIIKNWDIMNI